MKKQLTQLKQYKGIDIADLLFSGRPGTVINLRPDTKCNQYKRFEIDCRTHRGINEERTECDNSEQSGTGSPDDLKKKKKKKINNEKKWEKKKKKKREMENSNNT